MTLRTLALLLIAPLAACSAPGSTSAQNNGSGENPADPGPPEPPISSDPVIREARLSPSNGARLRALGEPVLLPRLGPEWSERSVETSTEYGTSYLILWRRADGACLLLNGSNDGLGGPDYPIVSTEVTLTSLPGQPRYSVYKAADDPAATSAEDWGPGTLVSDYVSVGGSMSYWLNSYADDDGCRPLALLEGAQILASLRLLGDRLGSQLEIEPVDEAFALTFDDRDLGTMLFGDDVTADALVGPTPEAAVRAYMGGTGLGEPQIEVLSRSADEVRILATLTNLPDDSVRDERTLFTFKRVGSALQFHSAGRQVRCWPNRGHQDWSAAFCS